MSSRLPFWKLLANVDSGPKVERELRTFSNRLRRHQLGEGVISLNEHSTNLLSDMVRASNALKCYSPPPLMVHMQQNAAAGWLFVHHYLQQSSSYDSDAAGIDLHFLRIIVRTNLKNVTM